MHKLGLQVGLSMKVDFQKCEGPHKWLPSILRLGGPLKFKILKNMSTLKWQNKT